MNLEGLGKWSSILANVGVIVGLLLVAVQINEGTAITKAQVMNDYFLADMQLELKMMGQNPGASWTKAVYSPDKLTQEDLVVLDRYFNYGVIQISRLVEMHKYGLTDKTQLSRRIAYMKWQLGNETGRRWWAGSKPSGLPPEIVEEIDKILKSGDRQKNRSVLDSMSPANAESK